MFYSLLADIVLLIHLAFVLFVIVMVPLILIGGAKKWVWVRMLWLRLVHLLGVGIVVAQSWAGVVCPLTTLEMWFRQNSGQTTYTGGMIENLLQQLLYWNAPSWVFVVVYTLFLIIVLSTWFFVPPKRTAVRFL